MKAPLPRAAVFGLAAIVVPAAIVAVLGYLSLRQWESSAELLFREQARDMATMAVDKIHMILRRAEDDALARLEAALAAEQAREAALQRFLADTPIVHSLYLFDRAGRLLYPASPGGDAAVFAALLAEVSPGLWERGGRRHVAAGGRPAVAAVLRSASGPLLLAALTASVETLRREVFETTIRPLEASTICAVIDEHGRPIYAQRPVDQAQLIVAVPFREGLPDWRLALYEPPGTSPRESVRRQVVVFTAAFGVMLAVIVAGVVATWRLVRRETEMARLKSDFVANVSHDLKTP
ncbi:MAG TPA: hypothetical protein VLF19_09150, partial [Methylomirabilota bacterium]|nr:hypothetical protein [Methylomirabilota bacterium]